MTKTLCERLKEQTEGIVIRKATREELVKLLRAITREQGRICREFAEELRDEAKQLEEPYGMNIADRIWKEEEKL